MQEFAKFMKRHSVWQIFLISFFGTLVLIVTAQHELNEDWAWKLAESLITLNGIILGFSIIALTMQIERVFPQSRMIKVFEKHLIDFIKELKLGELADSEKIEEKLVSSMDDAVKEIYVIPVWTIVAIFNLVMSTALAISLFGVSDTTSADAVLRNFFHFIAGTSIINLMFGIFATFKSLTGIMMKSFETQVLKSFKTLFEEFSENKKE